jgi:glycine cleavage system transcriptional repressor
MLGNEFSAMVMVQGNWNTLARLEVQLKRLEQSSGLTFVYKRTQEHQRQEDVLPYAVEVIALNHLSIVHELANFFTHRSISIEDLVSHSYKAPHTGTDMFSVNIVIGIPVDTHIATLREEFMDFCDQLNLDSVMEPIKG